MLRETRIVRTATIFRDISEGFIRELSPPRLSPRLRYRLLAAVVTALGGVAAAVSAPQNSGLSGRLWLVFFVIAAPLLALARLLPDVHAALALVVGAAGAVTVNALVTQSMLAADMWSPRGGVVAVGLVAAVLWLVPAGRHRADSVRHPPSPGR